MHRRAVILQVAAAVIAMAAAGVCAAGTAKARVAASSISRLECQPISYLTDPSDYRERDSTTQMQWGIQDVFRNHLYPALERMRQGDYSEPVMADLNFLLRHWPNHLPGLEALIQYAAGGGKPYNFEPPNCYFLRAREFVPQDVGVVLLEGYYFWQKADTARAIETYQTALRIDPKSLDAHYNLGLLYFQMGDYGKAVANARVAYAGGYPLPGLRNMLQRSGHWGDPKSR